MTVERMTSAGVPLRWEGTWVALATPFAKGESTSAVQPAVFDEAAFRRLIQHVLGADRGAPILNGLVPCGTTGEAATLTDSEFVHIVRTAVDEAAGAVPVVAGTGTNNTAVTIERTRLARELGCDGALIVTPYYNKPTQAGLLAHYRAVAQAVPGFPIVLYTVPGRTSVNMTAETVAALAELDEVVAVKEASGDLGQVQEILQLAGSKLAVLSGDDALALPMYSVGAKGVISVTANVAPEPMARIYRSYAAGDVAAARQAQARLFPLFGALFAETNPGPCKAALAAIGIMDETLRLPLVGVSDATRQRVAETLNSAELLAVTS